MDLIAHHWRRFCLGAFITIGVGMVIGSVVNHRNIPTYVTSTVRPRPVLPRVVALEEDPFLSQNSAAMDRMMSGMTIGPTGDVDRDFVTMMTAHHQGAIDMAQALLRYGHNERLRRLAQEIIVTQQEEIAAMWFAVGANLPPSVPAPDQVSMQAELTSK